jgi:hypothetical protein
MGKVTLRGHRGHSHPGQVRPGLEDDVAGLPRGIQLPVELDQVVQLQGQDVLETQQCPALEPPPGRQFPVGGEQAGERGEVERKTREPVRAWPARAGSRPPLSSCAAPCSGLSAPGSGRH